MFLTNVVCSADLRCNINLGHLCQRLVNVKYDPSHFSGLVWQHKTIGGNCLVFSNGKINCNGKADSFKEGIKRLRRYARYLQKMGYDVTLNDVKVLTASAFHAFDDHLNIKELGEQRGTRYEPELFPTATFKRENVTFSCFHNGKIIITGIKKLSDIDDVIYPTLLELDLYTITP